MRTGNSPDINTVEKRFRGSIGVQGWRGAVQVRKKGDEEKERKAVESLQEMYGPTVDGIRELREVTGRYVLGAR